MRVRIVILGLIYLLMLGSISPAKKKNDINPWQSLFTEPIEKVYIIMKDGTIFQHSNQDETMINIKIGMLEKRLKEKNSSIKEIAIVIHNHRRNKNFPRADYKQYWMFKKYGFNGRFLMYCHRTNKTYDIEDEAN